MKLRKIKLLLLPIAFLLAGCGGSTGLSKTTFLDTALTDACAAPVTIPERPLKQTDIEAYWGKDRASLINCGQRQQNLVKAVKGI